MFRWILTLRKLFTPQPVHKTSTSASCGFPRERLKPRRSRPTVKLSLESLTERILPSVSPMVPLPPSLPVMSGAPPLAPPPVADVTSLLSAARDQQTYLITILKHDLSSASNTIAQEVASVHQQWEHLQGSITNAPTSPLSIGPPQAAHGSSNSSSQTTQPTVSSVPLVVKQADEYLWDPPNPGTDIKASTPTNWLLNGKKNVAGTLPGSQAMDRVQFDPGSPNITDGHGNADITWDKSFTKSTNTAFSTMYLGGATAYTGTQWIATNVTVELTNANGAGALSEPVNSSQLNLDFGNALSVFQIDSDATITNMTLAGSPAGNFLINGGTTNIAQASGYTDSIGVYFAVNTGATLTDWSYDSLQFSNNALQIYVAGTMYVYFGSGVSTLIDPASFAKDYINVDGGTLTYLGASTKTDDTFKVPVLVQGSGTFQLIACPGTNPGGKLTVQGVVPGQTTNASVYMTGAASSVQLSQKATLEADGDYYQASGTLETMDTSTCTLQDGPKSTGTANIAGGRLIIVAVGPGYAQLNINCASLNFAGTYYAAIAGNTGSPGTSDKLNLGSGTIDLTGSSLTVYVNGTPVNGNTWIIIQSGNILNNSDFKKPITTIPQTTLNSAPTNRTRDSMW